MKVMEWGVRWAVEARRKGSEEQEKREQQEQGAEHRTGAQQAMQASAVSTKKDC